MLTLLSWVVAVGVAAPWSGGSPAAADLPLPIAALAVDGDGAWSVGADGAALLGTDLLVYREVALPGSSLALTHDDLWVCSESGLWRVPRDEGEAEQLASQPCVAVTASRVWIGDTVSVLSETGVGAALGKGPEGAGRGVLAAGPTRTVAARVGGTAVVEWSDFGESTFRAGGPVAAIAVARGQVWWARADAPVLSGPGRDPVVLPAVGTSLSAAGGRLAVGLLPGGAVVVEEGSEVSAVAGAAVEAIAIALGSEDCPSLWLAGPHRVVRFPGQCAGQAASAPLVAAPSATPARVRVGPGEPVLEATVGRTLTVQLVHAQDVEVRWQARSSLDRLEVSPAGLLTVTPSGRDVGRHRVTLRQSAPPSLLETGALWIEVSASKAPVSEQGDDAVVATEAEPEEPARPRRWTEIAHHGYSLGLAVGLSSGGSTWQSVGQEQLISVSPALAVTFAGGDQTQWTVGVETMPTLVYERGDQTGVHMVALTAGLMWGNDKVMAGPIASAGVRMSGVGGRLLWLPVTTEEKSHGVELRTFAYLPSNPAGHVALLYTFREQR